MINIYGMKSESEMPEAYKNFIWEEGVPRILRHDNSQIQWGECTTKVNHEYFVKDQFTEPDHPQQNLAELHAVKFLKDYLQVLLDHTGTPDHCWLLACEYITEVHNVCANKNIRLPDSMGSLTWRVARYLHFLGVQVLCEDLLP